MIEIVASYATELWNRGRNYIAVHDALLCRNITSLPTVAQRFGVLGAYYDVMRTALLFDTSGVGEVFNAKIRLYCEIHHEGKTFAVVVVNGQDLDSPPTYHHYGDLLDEINSRGGVSSGDCIAGEFVEIELNDTGIDEISSGGITKFGLRSSRDISSTPPDANDELVRFRGKVGADEYQPTLIINFRVAGYIWVEGTRLHLNTATKERAIEGATTGNSGDAGYLWVEGTYLHYIDENGDERRQEGIKEGATGKDGGQFWIEGTKFRYIDADGDERYIEGTIVE